MSMSIDSMASMLNTTNTDATTNYNANALKKSLNGVSSDTSADELMQVCKDFESYFVEEVIKEVKKNDRLYDGFCSGKGCRRTH